MRRTIGLLGVLALGLLLPPATEAQCVRNALGRIFHRGQAQAAGACYSTSATITYSVPVRYQMLQSCGPQGCSVQYAQPTSQYLYAPAKSTPQAVPPLPSKATPQTSMELPPPLAPDAVQLALPQPPPPDEDAPAPPLVAVVTTDAYGYQPFLNSFRARFGLRPVRYNANLSAWAYQNSLRGFGHAVRAGRRQNAASGQPDAATVECDWEASPGHRDALLDPNVTDYGIAVASNVWTLNLD